MTLPFTTEQFFAVFADYNAAIWPAQIVAYVMGAAIIIAILARWKYAAPLSLAVLAVFWAWTGIAYHFYRFAEINMAAYLFCALFVAQAGLLAAAAFGGPHMRIAPPRTVYAIAAWALILYALVIYEALGHLSGHGLMKGPMFGVAPCPTAIFTIGVLLLLRGPGFLAISIIPAIWSVIGTSAAILLSVPEDLGLAAGLAVLVARWIDPQDSDGTQTLAEEG